MPLCYSAPLIRCAIAGLAVGFWASLDELRARWAAEHTWEPSMAEEERERLFGKWQKAVQRTLEWE